MTQDDEVYQVTPRMLEVFLSEGVVGVIREVIDSFADMPMSNEELAETIAVMLAMLRVLR